MIRKIALIMLGIFLFAAFGSTARGQDFYNNKTIRIVVGFSPGGGMDIYARAIGRHLGKNIPGKPTVIVENMPGAGSLIAANYLYKQAKPDGLTLGIFKEAYFSPRLSGNKALSSTRSNTSSSARRCGTLAPALSTRRAVSPTWKHGSHQRQR